MRLADKVCVITGAGSGMGRVAATMFARSMSRRVNASGSRFSSVTNPSRSSAKVNGSIRIAAIPFC